MNTPESFKESFEKAFEAEFVYAHGSMIKEKDAIEYASWAAKFTIEKLLTIEGLECCECPDEHVKDKIRELIKEL